MSRATAVAAAEMAGADAVLRVEGLTIAVGGRSLAEDVDLSIGPGEMVGLVGESGCGKSVTALSLLRLLPPPLGIAAGRILFDGTDTDALLHAREQWRGAKQAGHAVAYWQQDETGRWTKKA